MYRIRSVNPVFMRLFRTKNLVLSGVPFLLDGEFFPIPEYLNEWREVTKHLRSVYVAEHFMIHVFSLQADEGVALIKEYLKNTPNASDNHKLLAQEYFVHKPEQNELKNKILDLTKAFYE